MNLKVVGRIKPGGAGRSAEDSHHCGGVPDETEFRVSGDLHTVQIQEVQRLPKMAFPFSPFLSLSRALSLSMLKCAIVSRRVWLQEFEGHQLALSIASDNWYVHIFCPVPHITRTPNHTPTTTHIHARTLHAGRLAWAASAPRQGVCQQHDTSPGLSRDSLPPCGWANKGTELFGCARRSPGMRACVCVRVFVYVFLFVCMCVRTRSFAFVHFCACVCGVCSRVRKCL